MQIALQATKTTTKRGETGQRKKEIATKTSGARKESDTRAGEGPRWLDFPDRGRPEEDTVRVEGTAADCGLSDVGCLPWTPAEGVSPPFALGKGGGERIEQEP